MEIKKYFSKFLLVTVIAMATLLPCSLTFGMKNHKKHKKTTKEVNQENPKNPPVPVKVTSDNNEELDETNFEAISIKSEQVREELEEIKEEIKETGASKGDTEFLRRFSLKNRNSNNNKESSFVAFIAVISLIGTIYYFVYKNYLKKKPVLPKKRWWSPSKIFNIFKLGRS